MALRCEFCNSVYEAEAHECPNCGAPVGSDDEAPLPDFRFCPHCNRRLLALGSPACNYCGQRLPDSFLKVRDMAFRRISELEAKHEEEQGHPATTDDDNDFARRTLHDWISFKDKFGQS